MRPFAFGSSCRGLSSGARRSCHRKTSMPSPSRPRAPRLESVPPAPAAEVTRHAPVWRGACMTEPTELLLRRIREGDDRARQALYDRSLPLLLRWAHGRLPHYARGTSDTEDLVQTAL